MADFNRSQTRIEEIESEFHQKLDQTPANWDRSISDLQENLSNISSQLQYQSSQHALIQKQLQQIRIHLQGIGNSYVTDSPVPRQQPSNSLPPGNNLFPTRFKQIELPNFEGDDVLGWIYMCEMYFTLNMTPDHQKVELASSHFGGRAYIWHHTVQNSRSLRYYFHSWKSYAKYIFTRFGGYEKDPMPELMEMKQRLPVEDYIEYLEHKLLPMQEKEDESVSNKVSSDNEMAEPDEVADQFEMEAAHNHNDDNFRDFEMSLKEDTTPSHDIIVVEDEVLKLSKLTVEVNDAPTLELDVILMHFQQLPWFFDNVYAWCSEGNMILFEYTNISVEDIEKQLTQRGFKFKEIQEDNNPGGRVGILQEYLNGDSFGAVQKQFTGKVEMLSSLVQIHIHIIIGVSSQPFENGGLKDGIVWKPHKVPFYTNINYMNSRFCPSDVTNNVDIGNDNKSYGDVELIGEGFNKTGTHQEVFGHIMSINIQISSIENTYDEEYVDKRYNGKGMHKVFGKFIILIWGWYYKESLNLFKEFVKLINEHPGRWIVEWKIAWK